VCEHTGAALWVIYRGTSAAAQTTNAEDRERSC